jgi:hypothetical protein
MNDTYGIEDEVTLMSSEGPRRAELSRAFSADFGRHLFLARCARLFWNAASRLIITEFQKSPARACESAGKG